MAALGGGQVRGVAGDGDLAFVGRVDEGSGGGALEARRGPTRVWRTPLGGVPGPVALAAASVVVAVEPGVGARRVAGAAGGASEDASGGASEDAPGGASEEASGGAAVVALERGTGRPRWRVALRSPAAVTVACLAPAGDDVLVGGAFAGTLRIGARVVASAGVTDGFVARLGPGGEVRWLRRLGGAGADAVAGVAADARGVVIAGVHSPGAELAGTSLPSLDARLRGADGFVAALEGDDGRPRWSATFGSPADDAVAGVALDGEGRIAVAATARGRVRVGPHELVARGAADAVVAWWSPRGEPGAAVLLGGDDFDGATAIASAGGQIVVGGFFSGAMRVGGAPLVAGGGDDAFLAVVAPDGRVARAWSLGGEGREELAGLAAAPGGVLATVAHTAAAVLAGQPVASPADPMSGSALLELPLR